VDGRKKAGAAEGGLSRALFVCTNRWTVGSGRFVGQRRTCRVTWAGRGGGARTWWNNDSASGSVGATSARHSHACGGDDWPGRRGLCALDRLQSNSTRCPPYAPIHPARDRHRLIYLPLLLLRYAALPSIAPLVMGNRCHKSRSSDSAV